MQFYWTPQAERGADEPALTSPARLGRFLTLSAAAHMAGAAIVTWLSLSLMPPPFDEGLLVRMVDLVEPAAGSPATSGGTRRETATGPGAPAVRAPRAAPAARPTPVARPTVPPQAPAAPPATAPVRDSNVDDTPTSAAEDRQLAAATPKTVGSVVRGPAPVSIPAADSKPPSAAPAGFAGIEGGDGPRATVALPPGLVRGSGSAGTGSGVGVGRADGAGSGAFGRGGTGVDPGDPDFSEYFRLIERRVRAAWKFPESLGGTTQTVKIGFALAPEGSLRDARVLGSSSSTLNESALSAMRRAAPFPPLPAKFQALAGQPLVISFTVTIR